MSNAQKSTMISTGIRGLIGLGLGVVCGIIFMSLGGAEVAWIKQVTVVFDTIGNIFLRLLRMMVVPLVFCCITNAIVDLKEVKLLRNLGIKALLYFFITSCIFSIFGIVYAKLLSPGTAFTLEQFKAASYDGNAASFATALVGFFPNNIFESMAKMELLPIIVFCIFFGVAILSLGEKAKTLATTLKNIEDAIFKMIGYVMILLPIGAFCLVANSITLYGPKVMGGLLLFIAADWLAAITGILTVHLFLITSVAKLNFFKFLSAFKEALVVAVAGCSSTATLPISTRIAKEKVGVDASTADFVIPLGSTANMNGTAGFFSIMTVFTLQLMGVELGIGQYVLLVIVSCLLAISCSTVPNTGIVIAITVLTIFGLPIDAIGLVVGVYRFCDMAHTPTNCIGDWVTATCVSASNGTLNRDVCECNLSQTK